MGWVGKGEREGGEGVGWERRTELESMLDGGGGGTGEDVAGEFGREGHCD